MRKLSVLFLALSFGLGCDQPEQPEPPAAAPAQEADTTWSDSPIVQPMCGLAGGVFGADPHRMSLIPYSEPKISEKDGWVVLRHFYTGEIVAFFRTNGPLVSCDVSRGGEFILISTRNEMKVIKWRTRTIVRRTIAYVGYAKFNPLKERTIRLADGEMQFPDK